MNGLQRWLDNQCDSQYMLKLKKILYQIESKEKKLDTYLSQIRNLDIVY